MAARDADGWTRRFVHQRTRCERSRRDDAGAGVAHHKVKKQLRHKRFYNAANNRAAVHRARAGAARARRDDAIEPSSAPPQRL
jgi:hypothetical protein